MYLRRLDWKCFLMMRNSVSTACEWMVHCLLNSEQRYLKWRVLPETSLAKRCNA